MAVAVIDTLFVMLSVTFGLGSCEVSLNNFLVNGTASFGDTVNFTCTTVGSNTLAWSSPEYIGQNGQQLSLSPLGTISSLNSYAIATVTNTYLENGQRVLESNLTIIVQGNIPNASVTCSSIGNGESSTTTFSLARNPTIECEDLMVCPKSVRNFTCETRGSTSLSWESTEYIGGIPISFTPRSQIGLKVDSLINPNVSAKLVMNYETNGVRVLMSQLIVTVSEDILDDMHHMITCVNVGLGMNNNRILTMGSCGSQGPTESETTQSRGVDVHVSGPNKVSISRNNSSIDESSTSHKTFIIGCVVGGTAAIILLGAIVTLLLCMATLKKKKPSVAQSKAVEAQISQHSAMFDSEKPKMLEAFAACNSDINSN